MEQKVWKIDVSSKHHKPLEENEYNGAEDEFWIMYVSIGVSIGMLGI